MFGKARLTLTAWYAAAMGLALLALGLTAYAAARSSLDSEIDDSLLQARADLVAEQPRSPAPGGYGPGRGGSDRGPSNPPNTTASTDGSPPPHNYDDRTRQLPTDVFVVITTAAGEVLSNPRQIEATSIDLASLSASADAAGSWDDVAAADERYRIFTFNDPIEAGQVLHLGRSLEGRDHQLDTLRTVFLAGGVAGLVLSSAGGFWVAGMSLRPIRRSLDVQRRFVSDASHELRTPLAVVRANNELLLRHLDATVEDNLDSVEAIAAETDSMTRLVDDLLTLARADEGRLQLSRESLDLGELVGDVTRDLGALAEIREVTLETKTEGATVEGDRQRLRQLTVILVDNALKYTPDGGRVSVAVRRVGRRAELRVADSGPGIAPEHQARIFDRFYRVDSARARAEGGSGLGLAIARSIAEAHHGSIAVESQPGKGTTFIARLPLKD